MSVSTISNFECIKFGLLSAEEIKKMAVCKIFNPESNNGPGTVNDERMGKSPNSEEPCGTCGLTQECWGHYGYIDLVEPILHPMYSKQIAKFLKIFCKNCHRLLLKKEQFALYGISKLKCESRIEHVLEKIKKIDICMYCSSPKPKIKMVVKLGEQQIVMEHKSKGSNEKVNLTLELDDIKKIFDDIQNEDLELLGIDPNYMHPKSLVLTRFLVLPPCARPAVYSGGNICDDDLTIQLKEIVKVNNQLQKLNENPNHPNVKDWEKTKEIKMGKLKHYISTFLNNSKGKAKHPTDSRPLKGIKERLTGKEGQIRSNLMGKRVNFSARTVIGAEPTLKLGQVGIPYEVARIHTKPERVNTYNIEWLTRLIKEGKANTVIRKMKVERNGKKVEIEKILQLKYALYNYGTRLIYGDRIVKGDVVLREDEKGDIVIPKGARVLNYNETVLQPGDQVIRDGKLLENVVYPCRKRFNLQIGDVVERHLQKGDIILINRQPTLHKGSMMAMEVVPMPYKTFRFNLAATKSFNADFDKPRHCRKQRT